MNCPKRNSKCSLILIKIQFLKINYRTVLKFIKKIKKKQEYPGNV